MKLIKLWRNAEIGDDVLIRLEREIDLAEAPRPRRSPHLTPSARAWSTVVKWVRYTRPDVPDPKAAQHAQTLEELLDFTVDGRDEQSADPDEAERLQFLASPATRGKDDAAQIAGTLIDALVDILRLDFLYLRSSDAAALANIKRLQLSKALDPTSRSPALSEAIDRVLDAGGDPQPKIVIRVSGRDYSVVVVKLGLQANGVSSRDPHARVSQHARTSDAHGRGESGGDCNQRRNCRPGQKRIEVNSTKVAERTAGLAATNDELKEAEHVRTEDALRTSGATRSW